MEKEDISSNPSNNRPFEDVLAAGLSRRMILKGSLAIAATSFFGSSAALAAKGGKKGPNGSVGQNKQGGLVGFRPVSLEQFAIDPDKGKMPVVSDDYEYEVLIPWGTPLKSGITAFTGDPSSRPTAADQAEMIGLGHDGMHFFPLDRKGTRGILCINHEYGTNFHVFGENRAPVDIEEVGRSQNVHGVSVVEIREEDGKWDIVLDSAYNRRITPNTEMEFSGPVPFLPGSPIYDDGVVPKGTVNNCANGYTPWGTYLTCEENFDGYFGDRSNGNWLQTPLDSRYSVSNDSRYSWFLFDDRFDLSSHVYSNENKRFGWIVEIDPHNPHARPVKRTALGRFKHEGIALTEGRGGRVVGYMGDDQTNDYIYKFVSESNWKSMRAQGLSPLDHGKLYVARFNDDGSGDWLELTHDNPVLAAEFASQAEVLTYARRSGDLLGATPMNRPEWTAVAPNGDVYCTLTNNSGRASKDTDAANPDGTQRDGHIIRWRDSDQHTGTTFTWDIYVIANTTHGTEESFSDPDGLWIDPDGRVFIQTDGGQQDGLEDQLIIGNIFGEKDEKGLEFKRLVVGVSSDEITGVAYTPGQETMFINIQHPGNGSASSTSFPAIADGVTIPRDATLVLRRKGGGVVGS